MKPSTVAMSCIALSLLVASAQTPAEPPEFEVASVKPAAPPPAGRPSAMMLAMSGPMSEMIGFNGGPGTKDPGRIDYQGVSLKMLLVRAYKVRPYQISGPAWLDSERYDIVAKVPPGTDADRFRLMLQKLLTERFQITLHREMKEMQVYRLTVAKGGPKLQPPQETPKYNTDAERETAMRARMAANMAAMRSGDRPRNSRSFTIGSGNMAKFTESLSTYLDRPVKDLTQLDGVYSFALNWVPDTGQPMPANDDNPGPTIFAAIQEQLGLKLEAAKDSIEILVIDKADKVPISN